MNYSQPGRSDRPEAGGRQAQSRWRQESAWTRPLRPRAWADEGREGERILSADLWLANVLLVRFVRNEFLAPAMGADAKTFARIGRAPSFASPQS